MGPAKAFALTPLHLTSRPLPALYDCLLWKRLLQGPGGSRCRAARRANEFTRVSEPASHSDPGAGTLASQRGRGRTWNTVKRGLVVREVRAGREMASRCGSETCPKTEAGLLAVSLRLPLSGSPALAHSLGRPFRHELLGHRTAHLGESPSPLCSVHR